MCTFITSPIIITIGHAIKVHIKTNLKEPPEFSRIIYKISINIFIINKLEDDINS